MDKVYATDSAVPFAEGLEDRLKDPAYAAEYLNAIFEDAENKDFKQELLVVLRHVASAHGFASAYGKVKLVE